MWLSQKSPDSLDKYIYMSGLRRDKTTQYFTRNQNQQEVNIRGERHWRSLDQYKYAAFEGVFDVHAYISTLQIILRAKAYFYYLPRMFDIFSLTFILT